jgi:aspartyl protease family protein
MFRHLRLFFTMILMLAGVAMALKRHAPPAAQAEVAAVPSADEPYNPWGKTQVSPVTHRAIEPRVLTRDESGQFHLTATVNGHDTRFLVDTGADLVALTPQTARDLALNVRPEDYQPVLRTASGTGMGAVVRLDTLEVQGRRLSVMRAVVAQGLSENLLGQSALRQLGRVELKGDTMVIEPN